MPLWGYLSQAQLNAHRATVTSNLPMGALSDESFMNYKQTIKIAEPLLKKVVDFNFMKECSLSNKISAHQFSYIFHLYLDGKAARPKTSESLFWFHCLLTSSLEWPNLKARLEHIYPAFKEQMHYFFKPENNALFFPMLFVLFYTKEIQHDRVKQLADWALSKAPSQEIRNSMVVINSAINDLIGSDPYSPSKKTLLQAAVTDNRTDWVDWFIRRFPVEFARELTLTPNELGKDALSLAIDLGHFAIAKKLFDLLSPEEKVAYAPRTFLPTLERAIFKGDIKTVRAITDIVDNESLLVLMKSKNREDLSLFEKCILLSRIEIVKHIVQSLYPERTSLCKVLRKIYQRTETWPAKRKNNIIKPLILALPAYFPAKEARETLGEESADYAHYLQCMISIRPELKACALLQSAYRSITTVNSGELSPIDRNSSNSRAARLAFIARLTKPIAQHLEEGVPEFKDGVKSNLQRAAGIMFAYRCHNKVAVLFKTFLSEQDSQFARELLDNEHLSDIEILDDRGSVESTENAGTFSATTVSLAGMRQP